MQSKGWPERSAVAATVVTAITTMLSAMAAPSLAVEPSVATLQSQLQLSICRNDWDTAITQTGSLMASPDISGATRGELVAFRQQLQTYQRQQTIFDYIPGCYTRLERYLDSVPSHSQPLNWEAAFYSAFGLGQPNLTPDQKARQMAAARQVTSPDVQRNLLVRALSPARFIDTQIGSGVVAGAVSEGEDIYAFVGGRGDVITLELAVTDIYPGLLYTDDDSQLFVFDSRGKLLAANDDFMRLQSRIADITLPASGTYYIAITTYNNNPILDGNRQITGWQGQGGSSLGYTLTVTGLTPAGQLVLPPIN